MPSNEELIDMFVAGVRVKIPLRSYSLSLLRDHLVIRIHPTPDTYQSSVYWWGDPTLMRRYPEGIIISPINVPQKKVALEKLTSRRVPFWEAPNCEKDSLIGYQVDNILVLLIKIVNLNGGSPKGVFLPQPLIPYTSVLSNTPKKKDFISFAKETQALIRLAQTTAKHWGLPLHLLYSLLRTNTSVTAFSILRELGYLPLELATEFSKAQIMPEKSTYFTIQGVLVP
ncbi:MAG: hypothetical protein EHM49_00365 [Deltaproteobacteria bacterium]|nr:MAG: hypothetical protein EHM49_00365 [Deltaproteobacteria bacterium]